MRELEGRRFVVRGRVQGVGFRWWTARDAERRGLVGTVRNREDGAVEVEASGTPEALDGLGSALHRGPLAARVDEVQTESVPPFEADGFRILR